MEAERGLIVFLDALGTKGTWLRSKPELTVDALTYITDQLGYGKSAIEDLQRKYSKNMKVVSYSFSDTLIITFTGDKAADILLDSTLLVSDVIVNGIKKGIFFRGAMSFGEFYRKGEEKYSFIIGPAVDEAADWYEKSEFIGIYTTPSTNFILDTHELKQESSVRPEYFLKYDIPLKNNKKYCSWTLNWPIAVAFNLKNFVSKEDRREQIKSRINEMLQNKQWLLERFSNTSIGIDDYEKFKNTIDFYDYVVNTFSNEEKMSKYI